MDARLSAEDLEGHRRSQRLAFAAAIAVAAELREGVTEAFAAARMQTYLSDHGATTFFHRPFAWFGRHARFDGYRSYYDFHPGTTPLRHGDVAVLDVAPILDGFASDIAYSVSLGPHDALTIAATSSGSGRSKRISAGPEPVPSSRRFSSSPPRARVGWTTTSPTLADRTRVPSWTGSPSARRSPYH